MFLLLKISCTLLNNNLCGFQCMSKEEKEATIRELDFYCEHEIQERVRFYPKMEFNQIPNFLGGQS